MNMNDYLSSIPSVIQENIAKVVHREKLKVPHFNGYQT